jgi:hypothetical protein
MVGGGVATEAAPTAARQKEIVLKFKPGSLPIMNFLILDYRFNFEVKAHWGPFGGSDSLVTRHVFSDMRCISCKR